MEIEEKYLITGFSGFVSKHFLDFLNSKNVCAKVLGIDINADIPFDFSTYKTVSCSFVQLNLLDKNKVETIIQEFKPDYVLHLASFSSVAVSWKIPVESFTNNTNIFLNLIESIRTSGIKCRILSIGSSEEYGNSIHNQKPLEESDPINPLSPYAVARVSQEMLSKVYSESYGMDIIMTRSFNHIGTHQKDIFVIPSFVRKINAIKLGGENKLITGDITIVRDFIDVRAVVEAYYLLFKKGKKGEVYNICNGVGTSLQEIITIISKIVDVEIIQETDVNLVRPNDNKIIIGSNKKLIKDTGWKNRYSLQDSLKEIISYYCN
ncbi:MAG: GDP-mannose 4,6-dehydratase [Flavobacteriales bacterium]|nr:GDP-mannose 4,6-dehydratase [Flavobacteriales bacterium]